MLCRIDLFNKHGVLGLRILNTFTKQVGFKSTYIVEYSEFNMTETRHANTRKSQYYCAKIAKCTLFCELIRIKILNLEKKIKTNLPYIKINILNLHY